MSPCPGGPGAGRGPRPRAVAGSSSSVSKKGLRSKTSPPPWCRPLCRGEAWCRSAYSIAADGGLMRGNHRSGCAWVSHQASYRSPTVLSVSNARPRLNRSPPSGAELSRAVLVLKISVCPCVGDASPGVGGGIAGDGAAADRHPGQRCVEHAAAAVADGVAGDLTVGDRHRTVGVVNAAALGGGVVEQSTAGDRHEKAEKALVVEGPSQGGGVSEQGTVPDPRTSRSRRWRCRLRIGRPCCSRLCRFGIARVELRGCEVDGPPGLGRVVRQGAGSDRHRSRDVTDAAAESAGSGGSSGGGIAGDGAAADRQRPDIVNAAALPPALTRLLEITELLTVSDQPL